MLHSRSVSRESIAQERQGISMLYRKWLVVAATLSIGLGACGGGGDQAAKLLRETFTGHHRVASGEVAALVTITPRGPSGLKGPLRLSLVGPFENLGPGKLPASAFTVGLAAMGTNAALTIISTGVSGYVSFQGQNYKLPQKTYRALESSFGQLGSVSGSGQAGALGRLGIQPQRWLVDPQIVGDEGVEGVDTTHIRSQINVATLLDDLNKFLTHATSSPFPGGISVNSRRRIAAEVKDASFNVWTGVADKTLRRLEIDLTVPIGGQLSALLGRAAAIDLTIEYAHLNRPQTIVAPTKLSPYIEFQDQLRVLVQDFAGGLSGGSAGRGSTAGGSGSSGPNYQSYTNCVQAAGGDLRKLQRCAPLLNGQ
jgi:hypothetical protein